MRPSATPISRDLVLLGGGHAYVAVLMDPADRGQVGRVIGRVAAAGEDAKLIRIV